MQFSGLFTLKPGGDIRRKYKKIVKNDKKIVKNNRKICIYQKKIIPLQPDLSKMTCFAT